MVKVPVKADGQLAREIVEAAIAVKNASVELKRAKAKFNAALKAAGYKSTSIEKVLRFGMILKMVNAMFQRRSS